MVAGGDRRLSLTSPPILNYHIRVIIWALCYTTESSRIVEIRTQKHDSCDQHPDQFWCPRYSPSPPPAVVNFCHEARHEAQRQATISKHLLLSPSPPIYFDPEKDTLYIHNDKDYWIRDWYGGVGILTQLKHAWQPESLRLLSIDLDPIDRARSYKSFRDDLTYFQNLDQAVFVAAKPDEKAGELVRQLGNVPRHMRSEVDDMRRFGKIVDWFGWYESPRGYRRLYRGSLLKQCCLAVRHGTRFEVVASYKCGRGLWRDPF